jgi:hypothetical protein
MVVSFDYPVVVALLVPAGMYVYRLEMADHQATAAKCRWHPGVRVAAAVGICVWPVVHQAAEVVETCVSVLVVASLEVARCALKLAALLSLMTVSVGL